MNITSLSQTSPGRFEIRFDSGETLRSTLAAVTDARLYVGMELSQEAFEELKRSSSKALEHEKALEMLSRRPYSRKELKEKLMRKGIAEESADECVRWLDENGFLDDGNYASAVARHYSAKGYGPGRVKGELRRRGIDRETTEETLSELPDNTGKLDAFIARRLLDPADRDNIRKVGAALYRRGYSWEEIRAALRRFEAEAEEDE